jgi:serine/threonine protein kinase
LISEDEALFVFERSLRVRRLRSFCQATLNASLTRTRLSLFLSPKMGPPGIGSDPLAEHEKYVKVKDLASGAFGFVQLARNRATGRHVAIKFLPRGERIGRVSCLFSC